MVREVARAIPGARPAYHSWVKARAQRDLRRLKKRLPQFSHSLQPWMDEPYERYVSQVSIASMAASLQMCKFLGDLCRAVRPTNVLDLGSGFSSFVLRHYCEDVWSVDDDAGWLDKTRDFLVSEGVRIDQILHLDEFAWDRTFDLVFHDIGLMALREQLLAAAYRATGEGGVLVLDDVHKPLYKKSVERVVADPKFSLRACTLDQFGRFGMVVLR